MWGVEHNYFFYRNKQEEKNYQDFQSKILWETNNFYMNFLHLDNLWLKINKFNKIQWKLWQVYHLNGLIIIRIAFLLLRKSSKLKNKWWRIRVEDFLLSNKANKNKFNFIFINAPLMQLKKLKNVKKYYKR